LILLFDCFLGLVFRLEHAEVTEYGRTQTPDREKYEKQSRVVVEWTLFNDGEKKND